MPIDFTPLKFYSRAYPTEVTRKGVLMMKQLNTARQTSYFRFTQARFAGRAYRAQKAAGVR